MLDIIIQCTWYLLYHLQIIKSIDIDIPLFPGISLILQAAFCSEYMLLSENCWYLYPMAILGFLMGFILTSM